MLLPQNGVFPVYATNMAALKVAATVIQQHLRSGGNLPPRALRIQTEQRKTQFPLEFTALQSSYQRHPRRKRSCERKPPGKRPSFTAPFSPSPEIGEFSGGKDPEKFPTGIRRRFAPAIPSANRAHRNSRIVSHSRGSIVQHRNRARPRSSSFRHNLRTHPRRWR